MTTRPHSASTVSIDAAKSPSHSLVSNGSFSHSSMSNKMSQPKQSFIADTFPASKSKFSLTCDNRCCFKVNQCAKLSSLFHSLQKHTFSLRPYPRLIQRLPPFHQMGTHFTCMTKQYLLRSISLSISNMPTTVPSCVN